MCEYNEEIVKIFNHNNSVLENKIISLFDENQKAIQVQKKIQKELLWANIFNNTISDSSWLKDKSFSLGRWAIGYPCAYVLYRVLDEIHPRSILELGLGQSTKLTGQYTKKEETVEHIVIEHDVEWVAFFGQNYILSDKTQVVICPWKYGKYKDVDNIREFENFQKIITNKKFDLIMIDAPLGADMKIFSRIDVLKALPSCLADSFVIIFDDCNRCGEQHTFDEMLRVLQENKIDYAQGKYEGEKTVNVICSLDNKFVASM